MKIVKVYLNSLTKEIEDKKGLYCCAEVLKETFINDEFIYECKLIEEDYNGFIYKYLEKKQVTFSSVLSKKHIKNRPLDKGFINDSTANRLEKIRS